MRRWSGRCARRHGALLAVVAATLTTAACGSFGVTAPAHDGDSSLEAGRPRGDRSDAAEAEAGSREPTYVGHGTLAASTGSVTPALPEGIQAGDVLLAMFESHQEQVDIANANGGTWKPVAGSPQGSGSVGANSASRVTVFFSVYDGAQGAPTTNRGGSSGTSGFIAAFRGVDTNSPIDVTSGASGEATSTGHTITIIGANTTVPHSLVVVVATSEDDADTFTDWVNPGLTQMTERYEAAHTEGDQGHIGMATGVKAAAGYFGSSATTVGGGDSNQNWGGMTIALRSASP